MPERNEGLIKAGFWLAAIVTFLVCLLVPLSFSYVEIDQWAFRKSKTSNKVDTSKVYASGRYFFGISATVVTFERPFQHLIFKDNNSLSVFSKNGLELQLEVTAQYRLRPERLASLYGNFGKVYSSQIRSVAIATIKNTAPKFTVEDFVTNWTAIATEMGSALSTALGALDVSMKPENVQLVELTMPASISSIYLSTAIRLQENAKKVYDQNVEIIQKETDRLVSIIKANATVIKLQAAAQADRIIAEANAEAFRRLQEAQGTGLRIIMDALGIDPANPANSALKQKLVRYLALLPQNKPAKAAPLTMMQGVTAGSIINLP